MIGGVEAHCEELLPRIAALAPELEIEVLGRRRYVDPKTGHYRGVAVTALPALRGAVPKRSAPRSSAFFTL